MKKSFIKVGFMLGLALVTTVSLNSCSSDEEAEGEGEGTEQTDADNDDANGGDEEPEMDEAEVPDVEPKMDNSGDSNENEGKLGGKGASNMEVNTTLPEEKPVKKSVRGGDSPKVTTDGSN